MENRVLYTNTAKLTGRLKLSKVDGTYLKELSKIRKVDVLILDDFGLHAFDNQSREILLDVIDERHNHASTIMSSQIPVSAWYELIGEQTIADAILDRINLGLAQTNNIEKAEAMKQQILDKVYIIKKRLMIGEAAD